MADQTPPEDEPTPPAEEPTPEPPAAQEPAGEEASAAEEGAPAEDAPTQEAPAEEPVAEEAAPAAAAEPVAAASADDEDAEEAPRAKPEIPGADLEVDIVQEGVDPLGDLATQYDEDGEEIEQTSDEEDDIAADQPIAAAAIDLAAGARYRATG